MGYTNSGAVVRMAEFTETFQIYSYRTWVGGLTEGSTIFSKSKGRKSINKLQLFNNNPHEITMSCILVWEREVSSWENCRRVDALGEALKALRSVNPT